MTDKDRALLDKAGNTLDAKFTNEEFDRVLELMIQEEEEKRSQQK